MRPDVRVERRREIARIAMTKFGGTLNGAAKRGGEGRAPAVSEISASQVEKILLFSKTHAVPARESKGLRVLLRAGYGRGNARG